MNNVMRKLAVIVLIGAILTLGLLMLHSIADSFGEPEIKMQPGKWIIKKHAR